MSFRRAEKSLIEELAEGFEHLPWPAGVVAATVTVGIGLLERRNERLIIQCKHWKAWQVGVKPVREIWGLVDHEEATGAVLVTSGNFTRDATSFAAGKRLELIDGLALKRLVSAVKSARRKTEVVTPPTAAPARSCPSCGSRMVLRTAKRGANAGQTFWGCSGYPGCRETAPSLTG